MSTKVRHTPDETRTRILAVAEEHFRRVGYAKTAVADIAAELGMSPANVYRFFASKGAINEAIAERILDESNAMLRAIVDEPKPAATRLADMILAMHRFNKAQFTTERRLHDMVEAAMNENWAIIQAHHEVVTDLIAAVIRDGIIAGEFAVQDSHEAALSFKQFHILVLHPSLIAQCADMSQEADVHRLTRYALRALRAHGGPDA